MTAWPWPSSESTGKVIPAFVTALQGVNAVVRDKSVSAGQMKYDYATLNAVLDACKPVLTENGLAVTQPAANDGVHAIVLHSSGEWLAFPPLHISTQQGTPQAQGSALTFARRYQVLALLNIATEDDDGKEAGKPPKQRKIEPAPGSDEAYPDHMIRDQNGRPLKRSAPQSALDGDRPTPAMIRMAGALFNGRGWKEDERHARTAELVGHEVTSWNDMSRAEFSRFLDMLKAAET